MIAVVNIDCFHYIMVLVGEDGVNIQINLFQSEDAFRKQRVKVPDVSALPYLAAGVSVVQSRTVWEPSRLLK